MEAWKTFRHWLCVRVCVCTFVCTFVCSGVCVCVLGVGCVFACVRLCLREFYVCACMCVYGRKRAPKIFADNQKQNCLPGKRERENKRMRARERERERDEKELSHFEETDQHGQDSLEPTSNRLPSVPPMSSGRDIRVR